MNDNVKGISDSPGLPYRKPVLPDRMSDLVTLSCSASEKTSLANVEIETLQTLIPEKYK